jgi:hypothetical protein
LISAAAGAVVGGLVTYAIMKQSNEEKPIEVDDTPAVIEVVKD